MAESLALDQATIAGLPLLVAGDPVKLQPLGYFGFDVSGTLTFLLSIKSAFVGGTRFYLQAVETWPSLSASNGLELLFTR